MYLIINIHAAESRQHAVIIYLFNHFVFCILQDTGKVVPHVHTGSSINEFVSLKKHNTYKYYYNNMNCSTLKCLFLWRQSGDGGRVRGHPGELPTDSLSDQETKRSPEAVSWRK